MREVLKRVKDIYSECCVTILMNTHRTLPENQQDPILLKNLVKEVKTRLPQEFDAKLVAKVSKNLDELADSIDHRYNLESLVLFVNEDMAEYVRLPLKVENRTVVDHTFATRDLVRAFNRDRNYYVLVLSRDEARLIEAYNDKVIREITEVFPIKNTSLYPKQSNEAAIASRVTHLQQEFFNTVDKKLIEVTKNNPAKVLISTEESNYHQYQIIADQKDILLGNLAGNRMHEKPHQIVEAAWPIVLEKRRADLQARVQDLEVAAGAGQVLTDYNEIWKAVNQGRGKTLFVKRGFFQPAKLENDSIRLLPQEQADAPGVVDDIIDEMIEANLRFGGDSIFMDAENLEKYNGLALTLRY